MDFLIEYLCRFKLYEFVQLLGTNAKLSGFYIHIQISSGNWHVLLNVLKQMAIKKTII